MSLRVGCDLDGTVADMTAALRREAETLFGAALPADDTPLTERQQRRLWAHVRKITDFWSSLAEIESGGIARLAALRQAHGWEVLFLTQRPATRGETTQRQSQLWLQAHGFDCPSVCVTTGSRARIAQALALDVVVDDRAINCSEIAAESSTRAVLVWRDRAESVPMEMGPLGVTVVCSFADALVALEQMSADRARPRSFLRRARKALGF